MNPPSAVLREYLPDIKRAANGRSVLDLACGSGRNGLWLLEQGVSVVFADRNREALAGIEQHRHFDSNRAEIWSVDLEAPGREPLGSAHYGGIIVFRYLHRPLLPELKAALAPGGILIYETFTVQQANLGRPTNPDYLLRPGELEERFKHWEIRYSFEGQLPAQPGGKPSAIAQLVAIKPGAQP